LSKKEDNRMAFKEYTFLEYARTKMLGFCERIVIAAGILSGISILGGITYYIGNYLTTNIPLFAPPQNIAASATGIFVADIAFGLMVLVLASFFGGLLVIGILATIDDFKAEKHAIDAQRQTESIRVQTEDDITYD
jgi:hypothetical protein